MPQPMSPPRVMPTANRTPDDRAPQMMPPGAMAPSMPPAPSYPHPTSGHGLSSPTGPRPTPPLGPRQAQGLTTPLSAGAPLAMPSGPVGSRAIPTTETVLSPTAVSSEPPAPAPPSHSVAPPASRAAPLSNAGRLGNVAPSTAAPAQLGPTNSGGTYQVIASSKATAPLPGTAPAVPSPSTKTSSIPPSASTGSMDGNSNASVGSIAAPTRPRIHIPQTTPTPPPQALPYSSPAISSAIAPPPSQSTPMHPVGAGPMARGPAPLTSTAPAAAHAKAKVPEDQQVTGIRARGPSANAATTQPVDAASVRPASLGANTPAAAATAVAAAAATGAVAAAAARRIVSSPLASPTINTAPSIASDSSPQRPSIDNNSISRSPQQARSVSGQTRRATVLSAASTTSNTTGESPRSSVKTPHTVRSIESGDDTMGRGSGDSKRASVLHRPRPKKKDIKTLTFLLSHPRISVSLLPFLNINTFLNLLGSDEMLRRYVSGEMVGRWVMSEWGVTVERERGRSWPGLTVWEGFRE